MSDLIPLKAGTLIRDANNEPAYFKMHDGWYRWYRTNQSRGWLWDPTMQDEKATALVADPPYTMESDPEFKTYDFQYMPDLELPVQYEISGQRMSDLEDAVKVIRAEAEKAWTAAKERRELEAIRIASYLDNAAMSLEQALRLDPKSEPPVSDLWSRLTNIGWTRDEGGVVRHFPYDRKDSGL